MAAPPLTISSANHNAGLAVSPVRRIGETGCTVGVGCAVGCGVTVGGGVAVSVGFALTVNLAVAVECGETIASVCSPTESAATKSRFSVMMVLPSLFE